MNSKFYATLILLFSAAAAQAVPFAKGDAAAGKALFDKNTCNSCHAQQLGGDGSSMFTRANRKVKSAASLATQISRCTNNLSLMLFEEDEESIGAYLNKSYYKFK